MRRNLKQAILDYGPITVCVYADSAFQYYTGDVFNACTSGSVNHAVVLVGWDDAQGSDGVWILRNSWGSWWGEGGYMRIEYGCSSIGYGGLYLNVGNNGGCCFGEYCVSGPEENCQNAGGTFLGVGVSCEVESCVVPCVGDVTGDGLVGAPDLLALISAWAAWSARARTSMETELSPRVICCNCWQRGPLPVTPTITHHPTTPPQLRGCCC